MRKYLERREKWQDDAATRGQTAEDAFTNIMQEHLKDSGIEIVKFPKDLREIYGSQADGRKSHGVQPDHAIRNIENQKAIYVEIKRQRAAGNAHERACKFMMPGIVKSAQLIANQPKSIIPFWWIFSNGIATSYRYRQEIQHWFKGIQEHVLLWGDINNAKELTDHFDKYIKGLL